ncbi:hypothetical protein B0H16DRAFT_1882675 [Mycena metata]|uniref:Uncharacterized protein n=1 Tax=Mycena metata TaxID=1033252 RepID=A0AAD7NLA7_9AGAR|nr:hypothetical protein B0H16DRAFT_1882675 [Mycena metata]
MPARKGSSSESPKKAQAKPYDSPSKAKTPKSPGTKKQWKESLPQLWAQQPMFRHPSGTTTVSKVKAMKDYKLNDREIGTLPYQLSTSNLKDGYSMRLYAADQLMDLVKQKCAKLEIPLEVGDLVYHSHSGSSRTGSVSVVSLKNTSRFRLEPWEEHMLNKNLEPPPRIIRDYISPQDAATADPAPITWTPSKISGAVEVKDACRLYCITPEQIQDLSEQSKWIDLETVAKCAVTLHGGFYAHEEYVGQCRDKEEKRLTREIDQADKRKSTFRFSPMIQAQWDAPPDEDDWMYEGRATPKNCVAVFYPIRYFSDDDYGCDWNWIPYWGDF